MGLSIEYYVLGCYQEPAEDIELAKYAADAGFEGLWVADHFHPWLDSRPYTHHPIVLLSALMTAVPEVPVGTFVTCPNFRYHPPVLAQALATLDNLSPGRLHLGVGVGEALNELPFIDGEWPDWSTRAEMTAEAIEVMETLWESSSYTSYQGDHFTYDDIKLYTNSKAPIDIHWAATGPTSCRYAAEYADHMIAGASTADIENKVLPRFRAAADEVGRTMADIQVTAEFQANIGPEGELVDRARLRGEYLPFPEELDNPDPRSIQEVANDQLAEMSDAEIRDVHNIMEEPTAIIEELERLENAGVTRVIVASTLGDEKRTIDAFERDVIPKFD